MAKLIFIGRSFAGRAYDICSQRTTVGRAEANALTLGDASVSEHHAEIYDNGSDLIIRDLGSRNGTVVHGELIRDAQRPLQVGQVVQFGGVSARLELAQMPGAGETATDVTAVHFRPPPDRPVRATHASLVLESGPTTADENTLLLPRQPIAPQNSGVETEAVSEAQPKVQARWRFWVVVLLIVGGSLVLFW